MTVRFSTGIGHSPDGADAHFLTSFAYLFRQVRSYDRADIDTRALI